MADIHRPLRRREDRLGRRLGRRLRTLANDDMVANSVVGNRTASRVPHRGSI